MALGSIENFRATRSTLRGFTLVELLVVIAIIGILVALLLPAVQSAREAARRTQCASHLKQIALAMHNYHSVNGCLPPGGVYTGWTAGDVTQHRTNWAIAILPQLEQQPLFDKYDQSLYNTHANNLPVLQTFLKVMVCPTDINTDKLEKYVLGSFPLLAPGSYKGIAGTRWESDNGFWSYNPYGDPTGTTWRARNYPATRGPLHMSGIDGSGCESFASIRDGASNTLLIGEYHTKTNFQWRTYWAPTNDWMHQASPQAEAYTRIPDFDACMKANGDKHWQCDRSCASLHPGVIQFALCDGAVRAISPGINGALYTYMATIAAGELVAGWE